MKSKKETDRLNTKKRKELMIKSLESHKGIVLYACRACKVCRATHYDWYKNDEDYKEKVDSLTEGVIDNVENALLKNIDDGNVVAQIFYLKCKGKHRGYVEKSEIAHTMDTPLIIKESVYDGDRDSSNKETEGSNRPIKG